MTRLPLARIVGASMLMAAPVAGQMHHDEASLAGVTGLYETVRGYITAAAEQMPEEHYGFQPTPEVRTFGQLVGHVTNASYLFCSGALGEQAPSMPNAEEMTAKSELVSALRAAFAYCDGAYEMGAMRAGETLEFFGTPHSRLSVLAYNMGHDFEHYGNMVTYMRIRGLVPPSSQPGG